MEEPVRQNRLMSPGSKVSDCLKRRYGSNFGYLRVKAEENTKKASPGKHLISR